MKTIVIGNYDNIEVSFQVTNASYSDEFGIVPAWSYSIISVKYYADDLEVWLDATNYCSKIASFIDKEITKHVESEAA